jgi:hypothetical protein
MTANESVAHFYALCVKEYNSILDTTLPSSSDEVQDKITKCSADFDRLMEHVRLQGAMSRNEEVDDMSTQALELICVPFYMSQLASRRVVNGDHSQRIRALTVSNAIMRKFLDFCENVGLIREEEIEKRLEYRALDRTARLEAHRRKQELTSQLQSLDAEIAKETAKAKRMRRIMAEDSDQDNGEEVEPEPAEDDLVPEELLRKRHLIHAKLCLEEAFELIQMNQREMDMLGSLSDEEKKAAIDAYQSALKEDRAQRPSSLLHFPGSKMPESIDQFYFHPKTGVSGPFLQVAQSGMNYQVAGCGHSVPLRQQIRDEAFHDRNMPTQTLEEFAAGEQAFMQDQARLQQEGALRQAEEDHALGREGREERDRKKASAWDDWKDENPPIGISAKGNYS